MAQKSKFKIWMMSIRPKTLPAACAPVIIGLALAYHEVALHPLRAVITLFAALFIQIGTNLANDYYDFVKGKDTHLRVGPVRATQAGLVSKREMKTAFIIAFTLAGLCGIYLVLMGGIPILVIGILSIAFGILYTAGPFPLGYHGLGDLFVLIFFGPVAVMGTYYLQTSECNLLPFIASIPAGFLSVAILIANNLRDYSSDKQSGKKTLVVKLGYRFGLFQYFFSILISFTVPFILVFMTKDHYYSLLSVLVILLALRPFRILLSTREPQKIIGVLAQTSLILFLYSIIFSLGWIL
jgi:1,4-dihydroxy-2-naphthoate polyprenyltransferase